MKTDARVFHTPTGKRLRLLHRNCIEDMRETLGEGSVDVVVTSPPYNLGVRYKEYDDTIKREEYIDWMGIWAASLYQVLADEGSLFLNVGAKPRDPMVPFELLDVMREHKFQLQNVIHWVKSIAIMKSEVGNYPGITRDVVVGHYKPINSRRFLNDCHEFIFHLTKHGNVPLDRLAIGVPYQDKSNVERWSNGGRDVHCRGNTWFIPYKTIRRRDTERPHPATFPVELPKRCVKLHGLKPDALVLDPFLGIGTTAVACAELDIEFVGYEIARDYFDVACERLMASPHDLRPAEEEGQWNLTLQIAP